MRIDGNNVYADDGKWLYKDEGENRLFFSSVTLSKPENIKFYGECTNGGKEQWEQEHKQPEPSQS